MKKIAQVSAPAKAILCGQHAVVYGQDAIAFGIDLKCYADIYTKKQSTTQSNFNPSITVKMDISNQIKQIEFNAKVLQLASLAHKNKIKQEVDHFTFYEFEESGLELEEFSNKIQENFGPFTSKIEITTFYKISLFCKMFQITPINFQYFLSNKYYVIETSSQIPIGKGLGSSASFNSVLVTSLMLITGILKRQMIQLNNEYKNVVNHLSKIFEKVQHGQPSGIDNFVSIYGSMVLFNKTKNPPFKLIQNQRILSYLSQKLCIGFVDSGIQKNTKLAVSNVRQKYNLHLENQPKYKSMIEQIGKFPTLIITLLNDVNNDNEKDIRNQFFEILKLNHSYLKDLGLSNTEIEEIVVKYSESGKSVAKITGAGMGGVVLVVGQKEYVTELQKQEKRQSILSRMNTKGLEVQFLL